jgi:hypothetical protein
MTQRIIVIKDSLIHEEVTNTGDLELSICLWNDSTIIPRDWHDKDADHMELKLDFSIQEIISSLIDMHRVWSEEELFFGVDQKPLVELYKKELQIAIDKLNKIKFVEDSNEAN